MDKGIIKPLFSQHYNLKWTNYTSNILQMFAEQFSKESFTDITLACEGQYIKAHKMVLSACSPYFEEMLNMYLVPHPMVVMNGIKFALLKILVEFMYHGEVKVADEDLSNLLELAEQLQVKGLCNVRNKDNKDSKQELEPEENTSSNTNNRKRRRTSTTSVTETNQNNSNQGHTNEDNIKSVDKSKTNSNDDRDEIKTTETKLIKTEKPSCNQLQETTENKTPKSYKVASADAVQEQRVKLVPPDCLHETLKIRRPQNAFMIFANEFRKKLASENPSESNKDISVRLGNMWKTLPGNVKAIYYSAAKKANDEHKTKYPGYYYSPKEARLRKELKSSVFRKNKSMEALQVVQLVMGDVSEDTPQLVYTECADPEYDEVDFVHDIKEEEEEMLNVCDSSTSVMKTNASQ
ncbi:high mobility group B protein 7-like isoform X2 [Agrilus planipennis]|uniref:High mobility group B protein 7-like isoform X2 n=1 Tax=Agrilus planipennis TaxID=224129 RepID=A0A1W4XFJ1_AGRPL|nr:high mobility group B protein 7-like isoform X2 [Agrilus planipennis]